MATHAVSPDDVHNFKILDDLPVDKRTEPTGKIGTYKHPAQLDLSDRPAGYGFQYEIKLTDSTENLSKPILDKVILRLED